MDLFHCISTQKLNTGESRAKSVDREPVAPPRGMRRTSLHSSAKLAASNGNISKSPSKDLSKSGTWSSHYESKKSQDLGRSGTWSSKSERKQSQVSSRTLSPPPETLPRKFSRSPSVTLSWNGRLPRHPELPPLVIQHNEGVKLKDYLEKPRLVSTLGRRPSKAEVELTVEQMIPGLAQLSQYYNQTFLSSGDTSDSIKDSTSTLSSNSIPLQGNR